MEVLIRPFRPADWDGVFLLDQACFVPPYRLEYPRLRALVEDPTVAVLVIEASEEVPAEALAPAVSAPAVPTPAETPVEASTQADSPAGDGTVSPLQEESGPSADVVAPIDPVASDSLKTPGPTIRTAIVGGLMLKWDVEGARLVIVSVMVEPGFRRVGLGRRLIGWAEKIAQARRLPELLAPLEAENADGTAFLGAMGFSREPGAPPFFADPAGGDLWRRGVVVPPEVAPPVDSAADAAVPIPEESR